MALLEGMRIVVTGSTRGLGRAFALAVARHGAKVVVNGTNEGLLAEVEAQVRAEGGTCAAVAGSVADYATCERIIGTCVDAFGGIDVLVNNAGIVRDRTLARMSPEEFDEVIAVNLRGSWACGKFAAAAMKDTGGQIIQVISNAGFTGGFGQGNYAASKAGMMGLLYTWVGELAKSNIRVNAIWPVAETDMTRVVLDRAAAAADAAGRPRPTAADIGFGQPDDVANLVVYLCSPHAAGINGQTITCAGRKVAMWTTPREVNVTVKDRPWTLEDFVNDFSSTAGKDPQRIYSPF